MASFPDLRPNRCSAMTERWVALSFRRLVPLLAGFPPTLSVIAFPVDSELATLRDAKASVRTPAFLTYVREPAPGTGRPIGAST
jgi:hypothetical protein